MSAIAENMLGGEQGPRPTKDTRKLWEVGRFFFFFFVKKPKHCNVWISPRGPMQLKDIGVGLRALVISNTDG
jgi:hypothetical protein